MDIELKRKYKIALMRFGGGMILTVLLQAVFTALIYNTIIFRSNSDFSYILRMLFLSVVSCILPIMSFRLFFSVKNDNKTIVFDSEHLVGLGFAFPLTAVLCFFGAFGSIVTEILADAVGFVTEENVYKSVMPDSTSGMVVFFAVMVLLAPIAEEIIYRKIILSQFREFGDFVAIILSSLCFALMHGNMTQLIYTFFCGVFLAYAAIVFGNIKATIIMHILYNLINLFFYYNYEVFPEITGALNLILIVGGFFIMVFFIIKHPLPQKKEQASGARDRILLPLTNPLLLAGYGVLVYFAVFA